MIMSYLIEIEKNMKEDLLEGVYLFNFIFFFSKVVLGKKKMIFVICSNLGKKI